MDDALNPTGAREAQFPVHPLVAKLIDAIDEDEGVVELRGFIGPASRGDDSVSLYTTLELNERILVPRDAIIHVEEPEPDRRNEEPTRVYVKSSAELRLIRCRVTTMRADEASATRWTYFLPAPTLDGEPDLDSGGIIVDRLTRVPCRDTLRQCIQDSQGDIGRIVKCINRYLYCMQWGGSLP